MSDNNGSSNILSFLLGAVLGAGAALMLSPKSGKENREDVGRLLDRVKGQAALREKKMELRMFHAVDEITNKVIDLLNDGKEMTDARKEELLQAIAEARRQLETEAADAEG